jgi:hypothetical protein
VGSNFRRNGNNRGSRNNNSFIYAYPVFVGNYYDPSFAASDPADSAPPPVQPPVMAMRPADTARPVMIQVPPQPDYPVASREPVTPYQAQPADEQEPDHYLLAFKDHTVYSAIAYWFDGDTLHYFTTGSTHNQASVSLLDKELTIRLNKELGIDFHMPAAK